MMLQIGFAGKVIHARMAKGNTRIDLFADYYAPDNTIRYAIHGKEPTDRWANNTTHDDEKPIIQYEPSIPGAYHHFYMGLAEALENGTQIPVPIEKTRNTMCVIEAMMKSNDTGRRVYF